MRLVINHRLNVYKLNGIGKGREEKRQDCQTKNCRPAQNTPSYNQHATVLEALAVFWLMDTGSLSPSGHPKAVQLRGGSYTANKILQDQESNKELGTPCSLKSLLEDIGADIR